MNRRSIRKYFLAEKAWNFFQRKEKWVKKVVGIVNE
jgi:hypothetical protein